MSSRNPADGIFMSSLLADDVVEEKVVPNEYLVVLSEVVGWLYFISWALCMYPQALSNYKRKSVIGISFDFYVIQITGYVTYCIFNCFLFWSEDIQHQYLERHPGGTIPVLLNDVFFGVHGTLISSFILAQCFVYERGDQKISLTGKGILVIYVVILIVSAILAGVNTIEWLDFLYVGSYIKLAATLIKNIPQAVLNFKRKSTSGRSIVSVLLVFNGGILSMAQMIINSYNYDDWASTFGNPAKFGLGFVSVCFDILFVIQHYVLYREPSSKAPEKPVGQGDREKHQEERESSQRSTQIVESFHVVRGLH